MASSNGCKLRRWWTGAFGAGLMAVLLAWCGSATAAPPGKTGSDAQRRAAAVDVGAVAPGSPDATTLMDWAEAQYAEFFPGHPASQTANGFVYRHYPSTGNYIGVAGTGVWLLGPVVGNTSAPVYLGELAAFRCMVWPLHCAVESANVDAARLAMSFEHGCALRPSGEVKCWGRNRSGQLGSGAPNISLRAIPIQGLANGVTGIALGASHSCALTSAAGVKCWGSNSEGWLGNNSLSDSTVPVDVLGLSTGVIQISASPSNTCALMSTGVLKCWGVYQSGDETQFGPVYRSPTDIGGPAIDVVAVAVGGGHTCFLDRKGEVRCWGYNSYGQLGDGTLNGAALPKAPVALGGPALAISSGDEATCALMATGRVMCWGNAIPSEETLLPTELTALGADSVSLAVGSAHVCGLRRDGSVRCTGMPTQGQLGAEFPKGTTRATHDLTGFRAKAIAASSASTCALLTDSSLRCWGFNDRGQLGDGTLTTRMTPVVVLDF